MDNPRAIWSSSVAVGALPKSSLSVFERASDTRPQAECPWRAKWPKQKAAVAANELWRSLVAADRWLPFASLSMSALPLAPYVRKSLCDLSETHSPEHYWQWCCIALAHRRPWRQVGPYRLRGGSQAHCSNGGPPQKPEAHSCLSRAQKLMIQILSGAASVSQSKRSNLKPT